MTIFETVIVALCIFALAVVILRMWCIHEEIKRCKRDMDEDWYRDDDWYNEEDFRL